MQQIGWWSHLDTQQNSPTEWKNELTNEKMKQETKQWQNIYKFIMHMLLFQTRIKGAQRNTVSVFVVHLLKCDRSGSIAVNYDDNLSKNRRWMTNV